MSSSSYRLLSASTSSLEDVEAPRDANPENVTLLNVNARDGVEEDPLLTLSGEVTSQKAASLSAHMAIAASAFGLISDGYHNSLMTMTNVVFSRLYPIEYTAAVSTRVSSSLFVGQIIGQIFIGILCDRVGRKAGLLVTTALIVIGATLCTVAQGPGGNAVALFWFMTIARGITGVGNGGEYPASSTSASEAANEESVQNRGPVFVMATHLPLTSGDILVTSVFLVLVSTAGEDQLHVVWRACFGIGILLPLTVFYFRMRMMSSKLFREGAIRSSVPYWLSLKRYWRGLIGTCGTWLIYDFVCYPNGIFSAMIISTVTPDGNIKETAQWQLLLSSLSLPGVILGAFLCNSLGRRNTMILGFSGYVVFGLIIGCGYDQITQITPLFVVMYGLMACMSNLGPGNMTLLVSAESFPTPIRGTFFGISAAAGKVGAALGVAAFTPIQKNFGQRWTFITAAIFGALGMLVTYYFVTDMTGVDLAEEDEKFMVYLAENGWHGDIGENEGVQLIKDNYSDSPESSSVESS